MAFDFTQLEGFKPEMTADEKLALLEKYEAPKPDMTGFIAKSAFDKATSELADWKKKHNALLSEEERKEAERLEAQQAIEKELDALRKENAITKSKAEFLALGYDDVLAADTAKALADGDMTKVFANQKTHIENVKKAERAAALAGDPKPPAGHNDPPKGDRAKLIDQYNEAEKRGDFVLCQTLQAQIKALPKE